MTNVDDFMFSGSSGYPSTKIDQVGGKLVADLIEARLVDDYDPKTQAPKLLKSGKVKQTLVLDIEIDWDKSSSVVTGKDGVKEPLGSFWCKWTAFLAIKEACIKADIKLSQVGRIAIVRTADGPKPSDPTLSAPHQFVAQVAPRAASAGVDDLMATTPAPATAGVSAEDLL